MVTLTYKCPRSRAAYPGRGWTHTTNVLSLVMRLHELLNILCDLVTLVNRITPFPGYERGADVILCCGCFRFDELIVVLTKWLWCGGVTLHTT
jgi:hypothetical protein